MVSLLVAFGLSCILCLFLMPAGRLFALRWGLVDQPDGHRKIHKTPTPISGGVVIVVSVVCGVAAALPFSESFRQGLLDRQMVLLSLLAGGLIVHVVGIADDLGLLRGRHKLLGQLLAVAAVVGLGGWVRHVQLFGVEMDLGRFGVPFTMFLMLGAINSLNLIDGMDGLLGSVGVILSLALAAMALLAGHAWAAMVALALAGALVGFLRFNLPPASVFMGDSGSMFVGLILGTLAIHCSLKAPTATIALAMPIGLLILPIFDTAAAIVRRTLTGRSIYTTDRGHLHHCLLRSGFSTRVALLVVAACCLTTCGGVLASRAFNNDWIAVLTATSIIATLIATRVFGHAEAMLIKGRLGSLFFPSGRARHMEVRLQGSAAWKDLWLSLKILARDLNLQRMHLDVNAPVLHEGYHARWDHVEEPAEERPLWYVEIPMTARGVSVGRLVMAGKPDHQPVWDKIALVMKVVEDFNDPVKVLAPVDRLQAPGVAGESNLAAHEGHPIVNVEVLRS